MKILFMGLSASGKTFQSKAIAEEFDLRYISGSEILLDKLGTSDNPAEHFWFEQKGVDLNNQRDDGEMDLETDTELLRLLEQEEDIIIDSWTIPWLSTQSGVLRIYLKPTLEARAKMAYNSKTEHRYSISKLMTNLSKKDEDNRRRFLELYGFDIYSTEIFDIVFDNSNSSAIITAERLINKVKQFIKNRKV